MFFDDIDEEIARACKDNDLSTLKRFITINNVNHRHNHSLLRMASYFGKIDIVKWLVDEMKSKLNTYHGLRFACEGGQTNVVKFFIDRVSSVNDPFNGLTLLDYALGAPDVIRVLLSTGAICSSRTLEIAFNFAEYLKDSYLLMEYGARCSQVKDAPDWAKDYEYRLDQKYRNCTNAAVALMILFMRIRAPKDLSKYVTNKYVRESWLEDVWLSPKRIKL